MSETTLEAHYPDDKRLIARLSAEHLAGFTAWIGELEQMMDDWATKHGGRPYGDGPLANSTGLECWYGYYGDGYSAREAFSEDLSDWDDDGND